MGALYAFSPTDFGSWRGPGAAARQATELRREGVIVSTGSMGELSVDFGTYGWFPEELPSEAGEGNESEGGSEDEG